MRPVEKGISPGPFKEYREAKRHLVERLGAYCSFCERRLETHLAVEHVIPKIRDAGLKLAWTNFLLACVNCNSCKGSRNLTRATVIWPDEDDTFRALDYSIPGMVEVHAESVLVSGAQTLIELVGLDRVPDHPEKEKRPTEADKRWFRRIEIHALAEKYRNRLTSHDSPEYREAIIDLAQAEGGFSIWMYHFRDIPEMCTAFITAFRGTRTSLF